MDMLRVSLLLCCLNCSSHGRRAPTEQKPLQSDQRQRQHEVLKLAKTAVSSRTLEPNRQTATLTPLAPCTALSTLLLAVSPSAKFNPSASKSCFNRGNPICQNLQGRKPLPRSVASTPIMADDLLTFAEVDAAAKKLGCEIVVKAVGPAYRIELMWEGGKELPQPTFQTLGYQEDEPPPPELIAYSDGVTQPNGIAHLETIEVRKFTGFWARTLCVGAEKKEAATKRYNAVKRLYPGLIISLATACWIREKGPFGNKKAQLLCIRDDNKQWRSLVTFYRRLGFRVLKEVDHTIKCLPDRIFWGGMGTVMEITDQEMLKNGKATIQKIVSRRQTADDK